MPGIRKGCVTGDVVFTQGKLDKTYLRHWADQIGCPATSRRSARRPTTELKPGRPRLINYEQQAEGRHNSFRKKQKSCVPWYVAL